MTAAERYRKFRAAIEPELAARRPKPWQEAVESVRQRHELERKTRPRRGRRKEAKWA